MTASRDVRRARASSPRRDRLRPALDRLEERALMAVSITDFPTPTAAAQPYGVRRFTDGSVLVTERAANQIAFLSADGTSVTREVAIPTANSFPIDVTESGGFYWFTEFAGNKIGRMSLDGNTITEFPVPTANSAPGGIAAGPDGNVWFTENAGNKIGRIAPNGTITEFAVPTANSAPTAIVAGPLNTLYFTEYNGNKIGAIDTVAGGVTEFTIPTVGSQPFDIAPTSDGSGLLFTEQAGNKIGRLTVSGAAGGLTGTFAEFAAPTPGSVPGGVVAGRDGNVYFTEQQGNNIGRITPDGTVTEFAVPTAASHPSGIAYIPGPNARLAFAEQDSSKVGVALLPGVLSISGPTTVIEGTDRNAVFTVTRSEGNNGAVSVDYATAPGTAFTPEDFTSTSGTITFADGDTAPKTFSVPIVANGTLELLPNQTFTATLTNPTGQATLGTATAQVGIIDSTPREISVNDVTVDESAGTATFTVSLNTASGLPIQLLAQTVDGTAKAGRDYTAVLTSLIFNPGVTSIPVTVGILNNTAFRRDETFSLLLSSPSNAVFARAQGTGTIIDNDAPLVGQGATYGSVENFSAGGIVAVFTDPNGTFPLTDYTATITWGDGSASSPGTLSFVAGGEFYVIGSHPYYAPGTYSTTVTVARNSSGLNPEVLSTFVGQAVIADAPLAGTLNAGLSANQGVAFNNVTLAQFTDAGGPDVAGSYIATIDWGDGTPISPGFVTVANTPVTPPVNGGATLPAGQVNVSGTHTYAAPGTYRVAVTLQSEGGSVATASGALSVAARAEFLSGILSPASDSGVSDSDAITNVTRPTFTGFSVPGSIVRYFARLNGGAAVQIGQVTADASGAYTLTTTNALADGTFVITADATDPSGATRAAATIVNALVIDTVGPEVTGLLFNRLNGTLLVGLQDDRSGLDRATVTDGANYLVTSRRGTPVRATSLAAPTVGATEQEVVTLTFNRGRKLPFGVYTILVRSGGIADVAGNALDGEYYGTFPSGNDRPGGDFVATVSAFHRQSQAPQPTGGFASPVAAGTTPTTTFFSSRSRSGATAARAKAKKAAVSAHAPIATRGVKFGKPAKATH